MLGTPTSCWERGVEEATSNSNRVALPTLHLHKWQSLSNFRWGPHVKGMAEKRVYSQACSPAMLYFTLSHAQ